MSHDYHLYKNVHRYVHTHSVKVLNLALRYTKSNVPWPAHRIHDGDIGRTSNERRLREEKIGFIVLGNDSETEGNILCEI